MINLASLLSHIKVKVPFIRLSYTVEERKYCSRVMKKHFNKELVMTREGNENFESSANFLICDNTFVEGVVKVVDCHVTGKYRIVISASV